MNVRAPQSFRQAADVDPLSAALAHEILAEKAGTYGRLMRRLEKSLAALTTFDENHSAGPLAEDLADMRDGLLADAADALWFVIIQRDLCGFGHTARFLADLGVSKEVQLRMGCSASP